MTSVKDQAICIRRRNYSETSQIVTLFARASGKVQAIAKGSLRSKSKFSGGIDTLAAGAIMFTPPRGESSLATLIEFELTESFAGLRRTLIGLNCAQYAAQLIGQFTADLDPHERLYDAYIQTLRDLETSPRCETILLQFEFVLLREIGLAPVWNKCSSCGAVPPANTRVYFSSTSGGLLCRDCEATVMDKRYIEPDILTILQNPPGAEQHSSTKVVEAHKVIWRHIRDLIGKETASMAFVNHLLDQQRG